MPAEAASRQPSRGEELANSITHGIGAALAIGGLGVLTAFAAVYGNAWHIVSCSVYGATLVLLYLASTLYHSLQSPRTKAVLRVIDHSAIFVLIAGTYTPFTLVNLRGPWGWSMFGVIWGLALAGIACRVTVLRRYSWSSAVVALVMGWVIVVAARPLLASIAPGGLVLLLLGGLAYTGGVGFYAWRRLPYHHAIWHGFVLAGSVLHFLAILLYVVPVLT